MVAYLNDVGGDLLTIAKALLIGFHNRYLDFYWFSDWSDVFLYRNIVIREIFWNN